MTQSLQEQQLRERFTLLHKLVGKDICVTIPTSPGYRRFVHVYRVFGYAPPLPALYDPTKLTIGAAVGLVVSDFGELGEPLPEKDAGFLVVFDYEGNAIARVTQIYPHE